MMSRDSADLDTVQRWMMSVITHRDGVTAGIESSAAQHENQVNADQVESMICRSRMQSSIERLEVYSNAYRARLLEVLIAEYPALVNALGEEVFIGLAAGYLDDHPSQSYTLAELGRSFPEHLLRTRPENENLDGAPDWADFLIDLARLERTYSDVFDGPGIEKQPLLQTEQIQALSNEQWQSARLIPAPCVRLITFRFPVHEYASAVRRHEEPEPPEPANTWLAVTRRDYIVRRIPLNEQEFCVLSELLAGSTISEALQLALQTNPGSIDELANQLSTWFRKWSAAGFFVDLR